MFTLIGYKPNSDDYCRGCHMAAYSSDLEVWAGDDRAELIRRWAYLVERNGKLEQSEEGYTISVLVNGLPLFTTENVQPGAMSDENLDRMDDVQREHAAFEARLADELARRRAAQAQLDAEAARQAQEAKAAAQRAQDEATLAADRAEYARLHARFGGAAA
jgi:hypothetical protein